MKKLFILMLFSSCWCAAKTMDFKPLSIEVLPQDKYLVRGYQGKINVISNPQAKQVQVSLKQILPDSMSANLSDSMEDWMFSVQKQEGVIEITVRSPHSKKAWEKTLQSKVLPTFEILMSGPPRALDLALQKGDVQIQSWKAPAKVYVQEGKVLVQNGEGELDMGLQEGSLSLIGQKGAIRIESYSAQITSKGGEGTLSVVNFAGATEISSFNGPVHLNAYQGAVQVQDGKGRVEFDVDRSTVKILGREGDLRGKSEQGTVIASTLGEADIRLTTKEGNVSLSLPGSGASINLGSEEGNIYAPNYLRVSRLPNMKLVQGRMNGRKSGQVFVRSQSGSIRIR